MKPFLAARPVFPPKSLAASLAVGAALCFAGVAAAQDEPKVAVVDVGKIFQGYNKARDLNKKIEDARQAYSDELGVRMQSHHRLVEEIARIDKDLANPALAAPARAAREKQRPDNVEQTHKLEQEIREFRASRENAVQEMTLRVRTQVVEDVLAVINARVESKHYDLILNKSGQGATGRTVVLYSNDSLDITEDVLAALNRSHPAAGQSTPSASPGGG